MKNKKLTEILAGLFLTTTISISSVQAASVSRIAAGDRFGTANLVATQLFGSAKNIILVNGYGYADAVSATPLAKQLNAPILLTGGKILETEVVSAISSLGATKVYIVGGAGAVSPSIENQLSSFCQVERIASITDKSRMGTNAEVAKKVLELSGQTTAILVNGVDGYADALSVASIAAQKGYPVLFGSRTSVADEIKHTISQKGVNTILAVGGEIVLPSSVVSSVNGTKITSAADSANRFTTNIAVLNYFKNHGGLDFSNVYVAAGGASDSQFSDALIASAAAARTGSPLVLSGLGANDVDVSTANNFILSNVSDLSNIRIIGGSSCISSNIEASLINGKDGISDTINSKDKVEDIEWQKSILKNKILFENDIRLFTLYAFMNYTGYNDENNATGFSTVRQMVRDDLNKMNLTLTDNNYYTNKAKLGVHYYDYNHVLNYLGPASDFNLVAPLPQRYNELSDLPQQLKEFYEKANIKELYNKYKGYYDAELNRYRDTALNSIAQVNSYLRIDPSNINPFYIQTNLLDSYDRAFGIGDISIYTGMGSVITGPSIKPNIVNIVHEYLHGTINPITNKLQSEIQLSSFRIQSIPENTQASSSYTTWDSIVNESIIRALEYRGDSSINRTSYINDLTGRNGFVPAAYFDKRFDEFKDYNGTLDEFIKKIIVEYVDYKE